MSVATSARLPVPPPPMLPPLTTVTPGCVRSSALWVWPTTNTIGCVGGSSRRTASAGSISSGSCTRTTSTSSSWRRSQLVKASCWSGVGSGSKRSS